MAGEESSSPPILPPSSPTIGVANKDRNIFTPRVIIPAKRGARSKLLNPFQQKTFNQPRTSQESLEAPTTSKQAISLARDLVVQASQLAKTNDEKEKLLDLLEVFRDFTEHKRLNRQGLSIIASQVSNLEHVSKSLGTTAKLLQKPKENLSKASLPTSSPTIASYAKVAATKPAEQPWQTIQRKEKKKEQKKPSLSSRRLVLIQTENTSTDLEANLSSRNKINKAFSMKGIQTPIIACYK